MICSEKEIEEIVESYEKSLGIQNTNSTNISRTNENRQVSAEMDRIIAMVEEGEVF